MTGHIYFVRYITLDLYTITNCKSETCSSQNDKNYCKMRMIGSRNGILFKYGQSILNMELFILEYAPVLMMAVKAIALKEVVHLLMKILY